MANAKLWTQRSDQSLIHFEDLKFEKVVFVYNSYKSLMTHVIKVQLLPVEYI